jgi:hypothetical protein
MDDGQKTPHGHPDFDSYMKIQRVLVSITDGWTDGWTDREFNPVWASIVMFLQVHLLRVGWRNFFPLS